MPMIRSDATARRWSTRPRAVLLLGAVAMLSLAGCSSVGERLPGVSRFVSPYQIDIQQGNVVTREQAQALQPGMPRQQVRDILGSPLLTSVFHGDRWDYVFTFKRQGQALQQRRVAVFFKGDVLDRVEADELPSEAEFVSSLDSRRQFDKAPPLEASEEQLKTFAARNAPKRTTPEAPAAAGVAPVAYPPLESAGAAQ